MPKLRSFDPYLLESLKDPLEARLYLSSAFEEEDSRVVAIALDHVLRARQYTVAYIAKKPTSIENTSTVFSLEK